MVSADGFNTDVLQVNWNTIVQTNLCNVNDLFSSFYTKFNKLVNKHAPLKTISNRKAKQMSKTMDKSRDSWSQANNFFAFCSIFEV